MLWYFLGNEDMQSEGDEIQLGEALVSK